MTPGPRRLARGLAALVLALGVLLALGVRADRPAAAVEARHAVAPSRFVVVDGLRTHYRDRGEGPPIVLLHGSNASLFTWEGWTAALAARHRVVALDLPGHGLTGPDPARRYSAAAMADFLHAFVTQLGLRRFALAGNSMGGGVAWHYALAHPDAVERLILVDAAGFPRDEPRPFALRLQGHPLTGPIARWITPHFLIARSVREVYGDPARVTEDRVAQYEDLLLREGNREASRERLSAPPDDGLEARLGELRMPVLVLWGRGDRWILPRYGERFHAAIAGSKLLILDGLGHIPMEEDPARSVAPVQVFLDEAPAR